MTPHVAVVSLCAVLLGTALGCGDGAAGGDLALQQALASTAGRTEGRFSPSPRPLDGARPHRLTVTATIALTSPDGERKVEITRRVDRGDGGRFRVVDEREASLPVLGTRVDGREAVFDGARFASRRRFGPWIARDLLNGGHERALREAYDLGAGVLAAFGDYVTWKEDPSKDERLAGLPVRWAAASLNRRVAPRPLAADALAALRDHVDHWPAWVAATHKPTRIGGAVARTKAGELVAGELEIGGEATVEGVPASFSVKLRYAVTDLPKKASFALPDDVLPEARGRTWRMIQDVLGDDLGAPYR
ncbi:MAG: hypothetical protein EP329_16635 [Deltaproteobacteria bacterium]|nr:MAG: hypothetical protein EP329_16635 [Deltaproteobacteria bacterium]